jgi:hypothetical protein
MQDFAAYHARVAEKVKQVNPADLPRTILDGLYTHKEQLKGRLDFVAWFIKVSASERRRTSPAKSADRAYTGDGHAERGAAFVLLGAAVQPRIL